MYNELYLLPLIEKTFFSKRGLSPFPLKTNGNTSEVRVLFQAAKIYQSLISPKDKQAKPPKTPNRAKQPSTNERTINLSDPALRLHLLPRLEAALSS